MLRLDSQVTVTGLTGKDITDFLLHPSDEAYQAWWPGTHLEFHVLARGSGDGHVGDVVWMDERIGARRVRMAAEVIEAIPGEKVVWQLRRWRLRLPVRLTLTLRAEDDEVHLRHTITAGWPGRARVLDPLWRLYFSRSFASAMDRHVHTELDLLADRLRRVSPEAPSTRPSGSTSTTDPGRGEVPS